MVPRVSTARFAFLRLPLEIRQEIYRIALPSQDIPVRSRSWADLVGTPNDSMNLLRVNRQVSDEAREVLYGSTSLTVVISANVTRFLHLVEQASWLRPLPSTPSIRYMKHWQIRLGFASFPLEWSEQYIDEGLLDTSVELSKVPGLQTLKISFPCLCEQYSNPSADALDAIHQRMFKALEPLRRLRVRGKVTFIAACPRRPCDDGLPASYAEPTDPNDVDAWINYFARMPRSRHANEMDHLHWAVKSSANVPCSESRCRHFAARFRDLAATLEGSSAPATLTAKQITWLNFKQDFSDWIPGHDNRTAMYITAPVWEAMAWASDTQLTAIIKQASAILQIHVKLLRQTGRLEAFAKFAQAGIPEREWEREFLGMTGREHEKEAVLGASCYWYEGRVVPRKGEQRELIPEVEKLERLLEKLAVMTRSTMEEERR
ncbi:MAG: hypothetical protein Q9208_005250 [Pyrenodesmia sp. 3 TL-2023]